MHENQFQNEDFPLISIAHSPGAWTYATLKTQPKSEHPQSSTSRDIYKRTHHDSIHTHACELCLKLLLLLIHNNVSHRYMHCLEGNTKAIE